MLGPRSNQASNICIYDAGSCLSCMHSLSNVSGQLSSAAAERRAINVDVFVEILSHV